MCIKLMGMMMLVMLMMFVMLVMTVVLMMVMVAMMSIMVVTVMTMRMMMQTSHELCCSTRSPIKQPIIVIDHCRAMFTRFFLWHNTRARFTFSTFMSIGAAKVDAWATMCKRRSQRTNLDLAV